MSEPLLPCPWSTCGYATAHVVNAYSFSGHYWFVECGKCQSRGPHEFMKANAIVAWNRRSPTPESETTPTDPATPPGSGKETR